MLGLNPKFEQLLSSLKESHSLEDLANLSVRNMNEEASVSQQSFVNNLAKDDRIKVAPSILSANFLRLEEDIRSVVEGGCDMLHIDVMDGHFVPNLTIGPCVLEQIPLLTPIALDIHFMVEGVEKFIDMYAGLKPKYMSVHIESERHLHRVIQKIRALDISPAIALNPHTSIEGLKYILSDIDMVLVMSVNPGFGGQKFIESSIEKIADLKEMIELRNPNCLIQADGGITDSNILSLKNAGLDIAVAGSFIFKQINRAQAIASLKV